MHPVPLTPVAILMCVYRKDDPQLFERALNSIQQQDYTEGPVRVYLGVDGPVPQAIRDVMARQRAAIHRTIENDVNMGLARSLNRLLDSLEDEQFAFRMDSDDFSHPTRIAAQLRSLRARPEVDILGAAINEVDRSGRLIKTVSYPQDAAEVRDFITRRNPLAHPTVCFRRSAIERFGHYPEVPINQDWALWFKCLALGLRLSSTSDVLVDMTVSDDFFRRRGARRAIDEFRILVRGIRATHGLTWRYIYPVLRLLFRLAPQSLIKLLYRSALR